MQNLDLYFMDYAYQEAIKGLKQGGIPVGAVLVIDNNIVARGYNKRIQENSMIKHGETDCLENTQRKILPEACNAQHFTRLFPLALCAREPFSSKKFLEL